MRLGPSQGSCIIGAEDGPYQAIDGATPWAAGRQVWVPPFPERRQKIIMEDDALDDDIASLSYGTMSEGTIEDDFVMHVDLILCKNRNFCVQCWNFYSVLEHEKILNFLEFLEVYKYGF